MHTIVDRQELTKRDLISLTLEAPQIARKIRPGQFVVLRVNETGERVPLTVAYRDAANGTVTIIFQVVGKSTAMLASLGVGDAIKDLCGPLGKRRATSRRSAPWSASAAAPASRCSTTCSPVTATPATTSSGWWGRGRRTS